MVIIRNGFLRPILFYFQIFEKIGLEFTYEHNSIVHRFSKYSQGSDRVQKVFKNSIPVDSRSLKVVNLLYCANKQEYVWNARSLS